MKYSPWLLAWLLLSACAYIQGAAQAQMIANPGFEQAPEAQANGWAKFEQGYAVSDTVMHSGARSIQCVNTTLDERKGASVTLTLNQTTARPLLVTGWSKAADVGGSADGDYSLYVDLTFTDGTPLWGQTAAFACGTHDWQRRQVLIVPAKPLKSATVYALFRHHTGTVWFDDVQAIILAGNGVFDSQALTAPKLAPNQTQGWFARDVATSGPILPFNDKRLGLRLTDTGSRGPQEESRLITDTTGRDRAVTVYYVERFNPPRPIWWNDIRQREPTGTTGEWSNLTRIGNVGAIGSQSLYPFGCVTGKGAGRMVGVPPLLGPRVVRIGYHAGAHLLYVAFDLALTNKNRVHRDAHGDGTAPVAVVHADVDPQWGFRAAAAKYYQLFPAAFTRRATADGIWMPFTDPSTVSHIEDFGIAYHEGDNSIASDDALSILSFRYTEPMTWWMPMPKDTPRTYDAAIGLARQQLAGQDETNRRWAQALMSSGSQDENGRFNVQFQDTPWADGAVWPLNPNPALPHAADVWTKARLNYTVADADHRYGPQTKGTLDGEYLDSLEGWADVLDFRPESLAYSPAPPTFATDTHRPTIPTWFSVAAEAAFMSADLHRRHKLLMANSTPWRFWTFLPLLDIAGTETNWLSNGRWQPDSDAVFNLRRTLCYHKPYLLLQNTDFDKFGTPEVEKYFQRSLFYGVFPSMFSVNAADKPYWQNPHWYDRDRALFKTYIPAIKRLSAAGWEPVTEARSDNPQVFVERYGKTYLTVLNNSPAPAKATITLNRKAWACLGKTLHVSDLVMGAVVTDIPASSSRLTLLLKAGEGRALRLNW